MFRNKTLVLQLITPFNKCRCLKLFWHLILCHFLSLVFLGCGSQFETSQAVQAVNLIGTYPDSPQAQPPSLEDSPENDDLANRIPAPLWEGHNYQKFNWTNSIKETISTTAPDLLNVNIVKDDWLCPGLSRMAPEKRIDFWIYFLSLVAFHESRFNSAAKYTESFLDSQGKPVISRGLLQISIESARGYSCDLSSESDLHIEEKNLSCGLRIISRWVSRDRRIAYWIKPKAQGASRYWSVLRKANKNSWNDIENKIKSLKSCDLGPELLNIPNEPRLTYR